MFKVISRPSACGLFVASICQEPLKFGGPELPANTLAGLSGAARTASAKYKERMLPPVRGAAEAVSREQNFGYLRSIYLKILTRGELVLSRGLAPFNIAAD